MAVDAPMLSNAPSVEVGRTSRYCLMPGIQYKSFTLCYPSLKLVLHQKDDTF
jgi:hypothetical protein